MAAGTPADCRIGALPDALWFPSEHTFMSFDGEANMNPLEAQARALIAAALIVRGAVEIPSMPPERRRVPDEAGVRLRELTDYVYRLITTDEPHEPESRT